MSKPQGADIIPAEQARTLAGLLLERVRRTPDGVAYIDFDASAQRWTETSWRETAAAVGRWQAGLRREGLTAGDRVAIQMSNRREWVHFDMAALGLGLVTVPLYTIDRPANIRHILEESEARLLLVDTPERLAALAPIASTLVRLERVLVLAPDGGEGPVPATGVPEWLGEGDAEPVDEAEGAEALATIIYTSGTTGAPKGVMLSHRNILWNTDAVLRVVRAYPQDRFLSFLPLSHALERTGGYYLPMMAGASVAYARSIPQLGEDLAVMRPTVLISVPRIFERVQARVRAKLAAAPALERRLFEAAVAIGYRRFEHAQGRRGWSPELLLAPLLDRLVGAKVRARLGGCLRVAVSGGAPISAEIARLFLGLGVPLIQGYGLTEASPVVTVTPLDDNLPDSIGRALPDLEVRIGPEDELWVRSPGVMQGYWRQPQATAEVLDTDGWLHTGDQMRMDAAGHLFITGRIKDLIVLANGEKVPPADLELAIADEDLIAQVLVIGEGRPFLTALAVLDPEIYAGLAAAEGLDPDLAVARHDPRLEALLLARIGNALRLFPGYAKIRRAAVVDRPWGIDDDTMTPTMKLKRAHILSQYQDEVTRLYEGHA
jgi:long-chain acyl-CoA synthetase